VASKRKESEKVVSKDANRDPITGEPGAHPVGAGLGAALGGAAVGAAAGAVAGPIGAAVGAVAGGVGGGLAGKEIAENIDPTVEDAYWREEYPRRDYYAEEVDYDVIAPAYRMGWESRSRYRDRQWDEVEPAMRQDWQRTERELEWDRARHASRDAWDRIERQERERIRRGETSGP
jgi:hypothetical protein